MSGPRTFSVVNFLINGKNRNSSQFYVLKEKTAAQIKVKLDSVYGNSAPALSIIQTCVTDFKRGRQSCED